MRVVIVGCGKVGAFLARELRTAGKAVIGIDIEEQRAQQVAEDSGALGVVGDGTDLGLMREIALRSDDFLVAVTGLDEANLVACQLARTAFGIEQVLARLNDPRNRATFEALQIPVVAVTDLIVQVIKQEVDISDLERVALIGRGEVSVVEIEIPEGHPPMTAQSIALPPSSLLAAIERPNGVVVPSGDTQIRPGDRVLAVTLVHLEDEVRAALLSPRPLDSAGWEDPDARPMVDDEPGRAGD